MRDIVFRGKCIDNGEWIAGSLHLIGEDAYIFTDRVFTEGPCWCAVDPKTIGQYVGREDKHGTDIFEGDMCKPFDDDLDKMVVEFHQGSFMLCLYGDRGYRDENGEWCYEGNYGVIECEPLSSYGSDIEVIGNIHDNHELVEEKA